MDEKTSEIGDFYPTSFTTDLNGKKQEWEAVVLIPFIDEVCTVSWYKQLACFSTCDYL